MSSIIQILEPDGYFSGSGSVQMLIITTGRGITIPKKEEVQGVIKDIYHAHNGVDGYRSMKVSLERKGYVYSATTIHKYMNTELGLHSIVRPKKQEYEHRKPHKVFDNKLKQDFTASKINQKWCTDFTYLFLSNHDIRYN